MVHDYLAKTRDPPLRFIRDAARLLRVREAWLAFGEGPMRATAAVELRGDLKSKVESEWEWVITGSEPVRDQLHALLDRRIAAIRARGGEVIQSAVMESLGIGDEEVHTHLSGIRKHLH